MFTIQKLGPHPLRLRRIAHVEYAKRAIRSLVWGFVQGGLVLVSEALAQRQQVQARRYLFSVAHHSDD